MPSCFGFLTLSGPTGPIGSSFSLFRPGRTHGCDSSQPWHCYRGTCRSRARRLEPLWRCTWFLSCMGIQSSSRRILPMWRRSCRCFSVHLGCTGRPIRRSHAQIRISSGRAYGDTCNLSSCRQGCRRRKGCRTAQHCCFSCCPSRLHGNPPHRTNLNPDGTLRLGLSPGSLGNGRTPTP